jgi:hypothetical protein
MPMTTKNCAHLPYFCNLKIGFIKAYTSIVMKLRSFTHKNQYKCIRPAVQKDLGLRTLALELARVHRAAHGGARTRRTLRTKKCCILSF